MNPKDQAPTMVQVVCKSQLTDETQKRHENSMRDSALK